MTMPTTPDQHGGTSGGMQDGNGDKGDGRGKNHWLGSANPKDVAKQAKKARRKEKKEQEHQELSSVSGGEDDDEKNDEVDSDVERHPRCEGYIAKHKCLCVVCRDWGKQKSFILRSGIFSLILDKILLGKFNSANESSPSHGHLLQVLRIA
ncbi:hypothetical protein FB451DRAFT_1187978 [Mycena latifolia]|nr:hypothetical protein FB451DRAFT_1187978 [Mycena latifolia]